MRLLFVFPNFDVGGIELRAVTLIKALPDHWDVAIASIGGGTGAAASLGDHSRAHMVDIPKSNRWLPLRLSTIRRFILDHAPDIVVTHNWGSIEWALAARFAGVPVLHIESGFGPDEADARFKRRNIFRRLVLRGRKVQLAVPSSVLADIVRQEWHIEESSLHLVPDGIDVDHFQKATAAHSPWADDAERPLIIGTVAMLRQEKNIGRLLRAFGRIDRNMSVRLMIVGDGMMREELEREAQELGLKDSVYFAGFMDDPASAHALFDIFALSSDTEQTPNAVLQAMACGKPVVATKVGDLANMVSQDNQQYLVARDDELGFAERLLSLVLDSEKRASVGNANQRRAQDMFSGRQMTESYQRIMSGMAGR